ncbi:Protein CBG26481 [Caenorhabditis briggsae]|uniref:Protein CBG26481 n=1 Tax=Caenorhabditis briggsae TaxID=6238 RepID=B6IH32_CAEBR|nr:Protein CBG26481 [Caenorhabditis briggsae]CAR99212.1 Protein CBG26481 [Caenorhabditis briggsae]
MLSMFLDKKVFRKISMKL